MHGTPLQKKKTKNIGRNRLKQSFYYFLFKWTQYSKNLEIALEQAMQSPKTLLEKISNVLFRTLCVSLGTNFGQGAISFDSLLKRSWIKFTA